MTHSDMELPENCQHWEFITAAREPHGVLTLTLNRPAKRNSLTRQMLRELLSAVRELPALPGARVLVLTSSGPAFCSGMDLDEMHATAIDENAGELLMADAQLYHDVVAALFQAPMPTVAVVPGPAVAGGVGLVAACDLCIASSAASFALPEPRRGITAAMVAPLVQFRCGSSATAYMLLSNRSLTAEQAVTEGLVHEVHPPDGLASARDSLVQSILLGAPGALALSKSVHAEAARERTLLALQSAVRTSAVARQTEEAREGLQAFLENRRPHWQPPAE